MALGPGEAGLDRALADQSSVIPERKCALRGGDPCREAGNRHGHTDMRYATPPPARSPRSAGTSTPDCGRHRRCRPARPDTSIYPCARCRPGSSLRRGYRRGPSCRRRCRARCAARGAAARRRPSSVRFRSPISRAGSRSWRRRSDRVRPSIPIRSVRSSACPAPESSWWGHGSRNRSAAWRCRRR